MLLGEFFRLDIWNRQQALSAHQAGGLLPTKTDAGSSAGSLLFLVCSFLLSKTTFLEELLSISQELSSYENLRRQFYRVTQVWSKKELWHRSRSVTESSLPTSGVFPDSGGEHTHQRLHFYPQTVMKGFALCQEQGAIKQIHILLLLGQVWSAIRCLLVPQSYFMMCGKISPFCK